MAETMRRRSVSPLGRSTSGGGPLATVLLSWERRSEGLLHRSGLPADDVHLGDRNCGLPTQNHLSRGRMMDREEAMRRLGPFAPPRVGEAEIDDDAFEVRPNDIVKRVLAAARPADARTAGHWDPEGLQCLTLQLAPRAGS
jgi:hypothetical protein